MEISVKSEVKTDEEWGERKRAESLSIFPQLTMTMDVSNMNNFIVIGNVHNLRPFCAEPSHTSPYRSHLKP